MAEVLLFHHALGQPDGFHALADQLRQAGHTVHTPDLLSAAVGGVVAPGTR
jgi:esterase/lipase